MQEERTILSDAPAGAGIMRDFIPASPFARHVGIEIESVETDRARLRLP